MPVKEPATTRSLTILWCTLLCVWACRAQENQQVNPISLTLSQEHSCVLGKECDLNIVVKNVSQEKVRVRITHGFHVGYADYQITIKTANGKPVKRLDPFNYMNTNRIEYLRNDDKVEFQPGESQSQDLLLGDVAKITAPGTYLVQLQRDNREIGPTWTATSNELAVVVKAK